MTTTAPAAPADLAVEPWFATLDTTSHPDRTRIYFLTGQSVDPAHGPIDIPTAALPALADALTAHLGGVSATTTVTDLRRRLDAADRRIDTLIAALAAATDHAVTPPAYHAPNTPEAAGFTSPLERGTGACPVKGCTTEGAHVHAPWEVAKAAGRLTPAAAATWDKATWLAFLRDHKVRQPAALAALRSWAGQRGLEQPGSLAAVNGNQMLAGYLLAYVAEHGTEPHR